MLQLRTPEAQLQAITGGGGETADSSAQIPKWQQGPEDGQVLQTGSTPREHYHQYAVSGIENDARSIDDPV